MTGPERRSVLQPGYHARAPIVVGAGIVSALNYGKLPPALPALQDDFGLTLLQASWMVSLFMFAGAMFGFAGGSIADRFGPRRVMLAGLLMTAAASATGALAPSAGVLFASRAVESVGFLLGVLPGPAMLNGLVPTRSLRFWLGIWSTFTPAGMGIALIATPWLMEMGSWRTAWWTASLMAFGWVVLLAATVPRVRVAQAGVGKAPARGPPGGAAARPAPGVAGGNEASRAPAAAAAPTLARNARLAVSSPGPWLLSLCFLFYGGQFIGIFSFLPSVYADAGVSAALGALLTAIGVSANVVGNILAGILLQWGYQRQTLIAFASWTMAFTAWLAFGTDASFELRYASIVLLSVVGGLIPGTLFASAPFYAPAPSAVSTTVGMMQQGSGLGQLLLPPVLAVLAQWSGGWSLTWVATGAASLATVALAAAIARYDRKRLRIPAH